MLLIIDKNQANADTVSDIFNFMGIVSCGTTPESVGSEFSNRHKAILFIHPEQMNNADVLVKLARTYSLDAPVFAISNDKSYSYENASPLYSIFDKVFPDGSLSSDITYQISSYLSDIGKDSLGTYRIAGIEASVNNPLPSYFDAPVNLTKTETMILRFLIASYPMPKSASDILKYSFRSGKTPEPASIRTHISSINRKFMSFTDKHVISNKQGAGYVLTVR